MDRLLLAIAQTLEQVEHATFGVVQAKLGFDPGNRCFGAADVFIQPGPELLQLGFIKRRSSTDVMEAPQNVDTAGSKGVNPALEGLGMQMQSIPK